ncbi:MAG: hypothetical protein JWP81_335 [Ferruginibacter sp.]|nr:hypothetical protein [Ferruginibacter sp.]
MKNLKFVFSALLLVSLSSCLDTEEKIVLNANNSGTYSMTIDLGRMLKMASSMGNKTDGNKGKEKKDTTIYLKDVLNKAENLTPAEKALYKDAMVNVKMDEANNEMKLVMSSPFKNAAGLTELKNSFPAMMSKLKVFEKATGEKEKTGEDDDDMKMESKSPNPVGDQFSFMAVPGKISNTVTNLDAFKKKIANDSTLAVMKQMTSMMGDFNYRTIIVLPKAVKKYDGPGSSISPDKKTLTFFTTLAEMLEHPEKVSYELEY